MPKYQKKKFTIGEGPEANYETLINRVAEFLGDEGEIFREGAKGKDYQQLLNWIRSWVAAE